MNITFGLSTLPSGTGLEVLDDGGVSLGAAGEALGVRRGRVRLGAVGEAVGVAGEADAVRVGVKYCCRVAGEAAGRAENIQ